MSSKGVKRRSPDRTMESTKFDATSFLGSAGLAGTLVDYRPAERIYAQGDPADSILYIQQGTVKLSVLSHAGREAVVGILAEEDFFGEGALAGQRVRLGTAAALTASRIRIIPKQQMIRLLHQEHALSDRFIAHILSRNRRLEDDLVDQLFNASEQRLARTLLLLARYGKPDGPNRVLPRISQTVLAEIVGTTRSRVNVFMNKFRKLGFIEYNGALKVHGDLLSVVLRDPSAPED